MPNGSRYLQAKMPVLLNLRIALKLYGKHATPSSAAACRGSAIQHVHAVLRKVI